MTQGFLPHFQPDPNPPTPSKSRDPGLGPLFTRTAERPLEAPQVGCHEEEATTKAAPVEARVTGEIPPRHARKPNRAEPAQLLRSLFRSGSLRLRSESRLVKREVQGELSLANVKVKRNDLADADLELVRSRKAPVSTFGEGRKSNRRALADAGAPVLATPSAPAARPGDASWRRWLPRWLRRRP